MKRIRCYVLFLGLAAGATLQTGCVTRRAVILSEPPGAVVYYNGQPLGATPVDASFVYYGKYKFTLVKDGFEPLEVVQDIPAPWYEIPPLDFFSENLVPHRLEDRREFTYVLQPRKQTDTNDLLRDAQNLRNRGRSLDVPEAPAPRGPAP